MKTLIKIAAQKANLPAFTCLLFAGNTARATDTEVYAETTGAWQFDTPRLVKANLVKAALAINSKKPEWNGTTLNGVELVAADGFAACDYPAMPTFNDGVDLHFNNSDINDILNRVKPAMTTNDIRYYLNGIMINSDCVICATDGHRLHIEHDAFIAYTDKKFEAVIPGAMFDFMPKIDKIEVSTGEEIKMGSQITFYPSYARLTSGNLQLIAKTIDGKFPDYGRVIPNIKERPISVKFNGAQTDIAKKLLSFAKANKERFNTMKLSQKGGIIIASSNDMALSLPFTDYATKDFPDFNANAEYMVDAMTSACDGIMYLSGANDSALFKSGNFQAIVMPSRV